MIYKIFTSNLTVGFLNKSSKEKIMDNIYIYACEVSNRMDIHV